MLFRVAKKKVGIGNGVSKFFCPFWAKWRHARTSMIGQVTALDACKSTETMVFDFISTGQGVFAWEIGGIAEYQIGMVSHFGGPEHV
jgi:hypothetical protein